MSLPAAVIPFWYVVVSNHSQIHMFFVNRGVPAALAVLTAACLLVAARPRTTERRVEPDGTSEEPAVAPETASEPALRP